MKQWGLAEHMTVVQASTIAPARAVIGFPSGPRRLIPNWACDIIRERKQSLSKTMGTNKPQTFRTSRMALLPEMLLPQRCVGQAALRAQLKVVMHCIRGASRSSGPRSASVAVSTSCVAGSSKTDQGPNSETRTGKYGATAATNTK